MEIALSMKIESETKLGYDDVLIKPQKNNLISRQEINLTRRFKFKYAKKEWLGIPIIAANMDTTGTVNVSKILNPFLLMTALSKFCNKDELDSIDNYDNLIYTLSENESTDNLDLINYRFILVDVANGYRDHYLNYIKKIRSDFPDKVIIAGNVATKEMTEELILAGADIIKIGIGPGSVCTTRLITGVGYPQLSAILECSEVAHKLNAHIIADGGCNSSGDIAKAFGAGADFVMLGNLLSGHDECKGEIIVEDGKKYKLFYGMASNHAQNIYYENVRTKYRASEGKVVKVKYKGPIKNTIIEILGGLRSAHTYIGAKNLSEFEEKCTFIKCTKIINNYFK